MRPFIFFDDRDQTILPMHYHANNDAEAIAASASMDKNGIKLFNRKGETINHIHLTPRDQVQWFRVAQG